LRGAFAREPSSLSDERTRLLPFFKRLPKGILSSSWSESPESCTAGDGLAGLLVDGSAGVLVDCSAGVLVCCWTAQLVCWWTAQLVRLQRAQLVFWRGPRGRFLAEVRGPGMPVAH